MPPRKMPARKQPDSTTYSGRFAIRLRSLREKAGLTVEEVVERTGFTKSTIYYWESGSFTPNVEQIEILAIALQTKPRLILPEK